MTYASFSYYSIRSRICEELSRHADLMRDLAETGFSPENCEQWFERAVLVFIGIMFIIIILRVSEHFWHFRFRGATEALPLLACLACSCILSS